MVAKHILSAELLGASAGGDAVCPPTGVEARLLSTSPVREDAIELPDG